MLCSCPNDLGQFLVRAACPGVSETGTVFGFRCDIRIKCFCVLNNRGKEVKRFEEVIKIS